MNDTNLSTDELALPVKRIEGKAPEARMTGNIYNNILPARYLRKDADGDLAEMQEDLFPYVAKSIALVEAVFEVEKRDIELVVTPGLIEPDHPCHDELAAEVLGKDITVDNNEAETTLSVYDVDKFACDALVLELPEEVREVVVEKHETFEELMEQLSSMLDLPTPMNAGDELRQLSACFVDSPASDIMNVHQTAGEAAEVFQSGDGIDYTFQKLRPYGDMVGLIGGIVSGPVTFMWTFDQIRETIAQDGACRGAQMGVMRVSHPNAVQFLHTKNKDVSLAHMLRLNDLGDFTHAGFIDVPDEAHEPIDGDGRVPKHLHNVVEGHLSNLSISVGITDGFMKALYNNEEFVFTNPRIEEPHVAAPQVKEIHDMFGLGKYVEVDEVLSVPVRELWDQIIEGAWENDESGVVYFRHANKEHSLDIEKHPGHQIPTANPCSEQPLEEYKAYDLGHINLSTFTAEDSPDQYVWYDAHSGEYDPLRVMTEVFLKDAVDREELNCRVESGACFLENVVTMSDFPIEKIEEKVRELRKIGLGIIGLTQLYTQLGVCCGSGEGNGITQQLMTHINHGSKRVSHELAEECDPFEAREDSKYANPAEYHEWLEHHIGENVDDQENGHPTYSHSTTTIAPTNTTSMVSNTIGGCRPIYNVVYYKDVSNDAQSDGMFAEFDDHFLRVLEANNIDVETTKQETQKRMVSSQFDDFSSLSTAPDAISELFVVTSDLAGIEHAGVQCILQSGVDPAISKTYNFPSSTSKEDTDEVYRYICDHGGKGATVYRDGTHSKQTLTTCTKNTELSDNEEAAKTIVLQIHDVLGNVEVFLGLEEVPDLIDSELKLAFADSPSDVGKKRPRPDVLYGVIQRIDTGYGEPYVNISEGKRGESFELFINVGNSGGLTASFTEAFAKTASTSLRSDVDPEEITNELEGTRSPKAV